MATTTANDAAATRAEFKDEYWKVDVYPFEIGGEPDMHVFVLGRSSHDALNRVARLFPDNGRIYAEKARPERRFEGLTRESFLVERV